MPDFNQLANDAAAHATAIARSLLSPALASQTTIETSTAYTARPSDANGNKRFTNAGPINFTIPPNADVPYPIDTEINFEQAGAGVVTVVSGAGVTVNSRGGIKTTAGQFAVAGLKQVDINIWTLTGDLG